MILAALVCVYLILGVLYESFIHPLTILSTLPSAGLGALATLMLFGYEFSLVALIGTILLIGIVKKNGIMMVDFAISAERDEGLTAVEAIRKAALFRFRPIMMTTMAALLGGVPLMLSHGTGSEMRQPLGYTMVGGLIVSQALTLFTTPVIYLYLDRLSHWPERRQGEGQAGRGGGEARASLGSREGPRGGVRRRASGGLEKFRFVRHRRPPRKSSMFAPVTDDNVPRIVALINWAYRGSGAASGSSTEASYLSGERTTEDLLRADLVAKPDASLLK